MQVCPPAESMLALVNKNSDGGGESDKGSTIVMAVLIVRGKGKGW